MVTRRSSRWSSFVYIPSEARERYSLNQIMVIGIAKIAEIAKDSKLKNQLPQNVQFSAIFGNFGIFGN